MSKKKIIDPLQQQADEIMQQLQVDKLWRTKRGLWYTSDEKARERSEGEPVTLFKKSK
jgi:hypothetical protein